MHKGQYVRLAIMAAASFVAMYVLMYSMVNDFRNVHHNLNQFYMAALMAAPMVAIELLVMRGMYDNKPLNLLLLSVSALAAVGFFLAIRQQAAIRDRQFLRSMIPHHASAILMCEQATLREPRVKTLCNNIIASQQREIEEMNQLLRQVREQQ